MLLESGISRSITKELVLLFYHLHVLGKSCYPAGSENHVHRLNSSWEITHDWCWKDCEEGRLLIQFFCIFVFSYLARPVVGILNMTNVILQVSLELGGNAPCIIFDDANLDIAVKGAVCVSYYPLSFHIFGC